MNRRLSRVILLSTVLCVGPAIVNRLARAEEPVGDTPGPGQHQTLQAVLRALGLADEPDSPSSRVVPASIALASPASRSVTTATSPAALAAEAPGVRLPAEVRKVLQALGLMPADTDTALAAAEPSPFAPAAAPDSGPQPPTVASAPAPEPATPAPAAARALASTLELAPPPVPAPSTLQLADRSLVALDESALDTMRGGFIGEGGLKISFGIERAIYVNGNLVTTTSLNLSQLGTLSAGKAVTMSLPEVGNRIALIQNGVGNTVLTDLGPGAIGTVIQNTLNGQNIQSLTTINATVNSLGVLKSIEMQRNLRNAITDSLRR